MAIYSVHLGRVGRSTHRAGTAGAHARYVVRNSAASVVLGEHMPTGSRSVNTWLNKQELADRKNARVIEKIRVALPIELQPFQHHQLIRRYVHRITKGRAPWLAGIHDKGKDAHNPHAHILIRDRDIKTGRRVANLSDSGSCERLRKIWEEEVNRALKEAGFDESVDCRSLKDQGIEDRLPLRHMGAPATAMERRGVRTYKGDANRAIEALNASLRASNDNGEGKDTCKHRPVHLWAKQNKQRYGKKRTLRRKIIRCPRPKKQRADKKIERAPEILKHTPQKFPAPSLEFF